MIKEVMNYIAQADPEIGAAILREYDRQMHNIELTAHTTTCTQKGRPATAMRMLTIAPMAKHVT